MLGLHQATAHGAVPCVDPPELPLHFWVLGHALVPCRQGAFWGFGWVGKRVGGWVGW